MEKIWLKNYPEGVPTEITPHNFTSLADLFSESCDKFTDRIAYTCLGANLSFNELNEQSRAFAAYLINALGLNKGDRIALMIPNCLQYPIALYGALRAGLTVVNINPLYTKRELAHQLQDAGARAIVIISFSAHKLAAIKQETSIEHVIITKIGDCLPRRRAWLVNAYCRFIKPKTKRHYLPSVIPFKRTLKSGKHLSFPAPRLTPDDTAFLQYTGGTTGVAKGAVLSHGNLLANIEQVHAWVAPWLTPGQETIITALPLYHIFSLMANCLLFLRLGATNVLVTNPRDVKGFLKILKTNPFTAITGVNTLFNLLINQPKFAKLDFKGLKLSLAGGMALQPHVAKRWHEITTCPLLEAYGLTETSPGVAINPINLPEYNGSIGLPLPSTEISLQNDAGEEVPMDEAGELCIRGPQVMQGYWQRPEETKQVFTADGWLKTGDIATIDAKGFLRIVDRKKDMIIVSGFNVYPNEIEAVVSAHPQVLEVAAIGVPDKNCGEIVKIFVVKKNNELNEETLNAYCRENLTGYKRPKKIEFRDALPKSNVGKILRKELKAETEKAAS